MQRPFPQRRTSNEGRAITVAAEEADRLRAALARVERRHEPERVTHLAVYLASRECRVTGEVFSSCLGRYARGSFGLTAGWMEAAGAAVAHGLTK